MISKRQSDITVWYGSSASQCVIEIVTSETEDVYRNFFKQVGVHLVTSFHTFNSQVDFFNYCSVCDTLVQSFIGTGILSHINLF